jgi:L-threonylcarbamoyladenylate synthase
LRPGAVPRSAIENVLGPLSKASGGGIQAPGMLASHYAPRAKLRLNATAVHPGEALLAFGPDVLPDANFIHNLSPTGNLHEAAANLFTMLRSLDRTGAKIIAVMPIPHSDLGEAINDRLERAAHPRED